MNKFMQPIPVAQLLEEARDDIDAIRTAAGYREAHFQLLCMPVLAAFGRHVQNLPLSPTAYHDEGGAWRYGLTACMVALRVADTHLFFPGLESEERRKLEPQCRFAAFAAVLASAVTLLAQNTRVTVMAGEMSDEYHPLVTPMDLSDWLAKYPGSEFSWRTGQQPISPAEAAAIASRFMPSGLLSLFDLRVALMIFNSIAPTSSPNALETTLSKVVRLSTTNVLARFIEKDAARYEQKQGMASSISSDGKAIADTLISISNPVERVNPLDPASAPVAVAPPAQRAAPIANGDPSTSLQTLLANASPVLREWFAALKSHERYPTLKTHLNTTERGIEVPINMLGFFGVNGPAIKKMMTDAGMVIDRSADGKAIILQPTLSPLLFGE